jgi:small GTP-binding protein
MDGSQRVIDPSAAPVAVWRLQSPATAAGAVALIELIGDLDAAFSALTLRTVPVGGVALRTLQGIDDLLIARWAPTLATLMPHGGLAVTREVCQELERRGIAPAPSTPHPTVESYPHASNQLESRMLRALEAAASPLAVDLLLAQPPRWHAAGWNPDRSNLPEPSPRDRQLNRLLSPPLVVAIGPPNVGKSTIVNALAQRQVSIVADLPGTTRDHVGVVLNVGGLVIRYVDAPGVRKTTDPIEQQAITLALALANAADLLLIIADAAPESMHELAQLLPRLNNAAIVHIQSRADLVPGTTQATLRLEAMHQHPAAGASRIAAAIREALVPDVALTDPAPWKFQVPPAV